MLFLVNSPFVVVVVVVELKTRFLVHRLRRVWCTVYAGFEMFFQMFSDVFRIHTEKNLGCVE